MRESIFFASIRSFFITLFSIAGFIVGLVLIIALVGGFSKSSEGEPEIVHTYTPTILPNGSGIRKSLSNDAPVILKINIKGIIGIESLSRHTINEQLLESRERFLKNRVKAICLYIDSPGGTVVDADGIYRALKEYKKEYKVPVYAFVDGLCASGGMYIAVAADKIFASDVSMVGSIGVISPAFMNVSQLLDMFGVQTLTLYEGKGKDDMSPLRPWKPGEEDNLKSIISYYYDMFVDIVTSNRKIDKEKLIQEYGAHIFPAKLAQEKGYIDETGYTLDKTIKELAVSIGIDDDYYQVIELDNKSWFSELLKGNFNLLKGQVEHQISLSPESNPRLWNQYLYLYRQ